MLRFVPGQIVRFSYRKSVHETPEVTSKEVFVLNPRWEQKMHGIDMKRLTAAQRQVLIEIVEKNPKTISKLPLVNDVRRRMDVLDDIKQPYVFYERFVKVFLRNIDAYRKYFLAKMMNVTLVKRAELTQATVNQKPLFHGTTTPTGPKGAEGPSKPPGIAGLAKEKRPLFHGVESKPPAPAPQPKASGKGKVIRGKINGPKRPK